MPPAGRSIYYLLIFSRLRQTNLYTQLRPGLVCIVAKLFGQVPLPIHKAHTEIFPPCKISKGGNKHFFRRFAQNFFCPLFPKVLPTPLDTDYHNLQDSLNDWSQMWQLNISYKCNLMYIGNAQSKPSLVLIMLKWQLLLKSRILALLLILVLTLILTFARL